MLSFCNLSCVCVLFCVQNIAKLLHVKVLTNFDPELLILAQISTDFAPPELAGLFMVIFPKYVFEVPKT